MVNTSPPDHGRSEKINLSFYFLISLWCLTDFMKAFKAYIKLFDASQGSVKIKN